MESNPAKDSIIQTCRAHFDSGVSAPNHDNIYQFIKLLVESPIYINYHPDIQKITNESYEKNGPVFIDINNNIANKYAYNV